MTAKAFKIKATITVEIDAVDAYAVEAHRDDLKAVLSDLRAKHGPAHLSITARRPRLSPRAAPPAQLGSDFEVVRARHVR